MGIDSSFLICRPVSGYFKDTQRFTPAPVFNKQREDTIKINNTKNPKNLILY